MKIIDFVRPPLSATFAIATVAFTVFPDSFFNPLSYGIESSGDWGITVGRIVLIALILACTFISYALFLRCRKSVLLDDGDCIIEVKYGDLLAERECKRVIAFDECFTTHVGSAPGDIKATSICGQFLCMNQGLCIESLVEKSGLTPEIEPSCYDRKTCYRLGSIIPIGDGLLVAFTKLNKDGRAEFGHREEYLDCLTNLWNEIYKYYDQKDVAISILGSGLTNFDGGSGKSLNQQELLNMIIWSYKLSTRKIKRPQKLRIVCRMQDGFSLNKVKC